MESKNRGINWTKELAGQSEKDHKFGGASLPSRFKVPVDLRFLYQPEGEIQNLGEEKMDCVSRAVCNAHESEMTYAYKNLLKEDDKKFLEDNGYIKDGKVVLSDVFIAILSGTVS